MNRRLLSLFVFVALLVFCTGCLPADTQLYHIYLLPDSSGPEVFRDDIPTAEQIPNPSAGTASQPPDPTAEVLFGNTLRELKLNRQKSGQWNIYESDDGVLSCRFDPNGGMLRFISAESWLDPNQASNMSEEDYLAWVQEVVSRYYTEDWSEYTSSCSTEIRGSLTDSEKRQTKKGFHTPNETYESIASYTFTFTKYLGERATSDEIRAYIQPGTGFVELEFSAHDFDDTEAVEIDPELIQASVFQFLSDSIAETRYAYTRHSTSLSKLTYIHGHLCYICTVRIDVVTLDDHQKFETDEVLQPVAILLN